MVFRPIRMEAQPLRRPRKPRRSTSTRSTRSARPSLEPVWVRNRFICNCCGFCNLLIKSSLLRMWVSHDDCILRGTYIKSYIWFSHPKYVNLAIYGLCFSQKSLTLNIDGSYKISCFNWYLLVCDTCCFSQCISTIICVPLMIFVMSLMSWEFVYIIWDKMELYALLLKTSFRVSCPSL